MKLRWDAVYQLAKTKLVWITVKVISQGPKGQKRVNFYYFLVIFSKTVFIIQYFLLFILGDDIYQLLMD